MIKESKKAKKVRCCCFILCLIVLFVSAYKLMSSYVDYHEGAAAYDALQDEFSSDVQNEIAAELIEHNHESDSSADVSDEAISTEEDPLVPVKDFSRLIAINQDCVAWITLADTTIDYPVVQGGDNAYYLSHLLSGEKNKYGTLFVDYRNSGDFTDKNTIIYGHHMKDGSMFTALENFKQQSYYDDHSVLALYTPEKTYQLEPFAGVIITADLNNLPLTFNSVDAFISYIDTAKENSTFESDIEIAPDDKIVTLCTCTYDFTNARFVLLCRLESIAQ